MPPPITPPINNTTPTPTLTTTDVVIGDAGTNGAAGAYGFNGDNGGSGGSGITNTSTFGTLNNNVSITGGAGGNGGTGGGGFLYSNFNGNNGSGGAGINNSSGTITILNNNINGSFTGGAGGISSSGYYTGQAGSGGAGINNGAGTITTLTNNGSIAGGSGSYGYNTGGLGGAGINNGSGTITTLTNDTSITGGSGGYGYITGGLGGAGINHGSGTITTLTNNASITGGSGGGGGFSGGFSGGSGGAGIQVESGGSIISLTNDGAVTGGSGGGGYYGGRGGAGINHGSGTITTLTNNASITGGSGGGGYYGGLGGAGINHGSGTITTLTNNASITGGSGGGGGFSGGSGGAGIQVESGGSITTLTNNGTITGGSGGGGGYSSSGGAGGAGINNSSGTITTLTNNLSITGGSGGYGYYGGRGGAGINHGSGTITTLTNNASITGGSGGGGGFSGGFSGGSGGAGIQVESGGSITTLTNNGTITGGSGGAGIQVESGGSITTLNNLQGASANALTLSGNLPTNYNIIINNPSQYGQIDFSNPDGTTTFGISTISGTNIGLTRYQNVITGLDSSFITNEETTLTYTNSGLSATYQLVADDDNVAYTWDLLILSVINAPSVINDYAPVFTSGASGSVDENAAIETVIYTAVTTDADGGSRTYSLTGADASLLNINASTGEVTLKASAEYENKDSYSFNVVANDGDVSHNQTQAVVVSVVNIMTGTSGNEVINGTVGADKIYGMGGNDTLNGGLGNDHYYVDSNLSGNVKVTDTSGSDTIHFNKITDAYANGYVYQLTKAGTDNANLVATLTLNGTPINTYTLVGEYNASTLASTSIENVIVTTGVNTITKTFVGGLAATNSNQFVVGSSASETMIGAYENSEVWGGAGNDTLTGAAANIDLTGGLGLDKFEVTSGSTTIHDLGYGGAEILNVSRGATLLNAKVYNTGWTATSASINNGTANIETNSYLVNLAAVKTGNGFSIENISATGATLTGSGLADTITGGIGNDLITGGVGTDTMNGADGSDIYIISNAAEHAASEIADTGVTGSDEIRFAATLAGTLTLFAEDTGIENVVIGTGTATSALTNGTTANNINAALVANALSITGNNGNNKLTGTAYADTLSGNAGSDTLNGGEGADTMIGGDGSDTYVVDNTGDVVTETIALTSGGTDLVQVAINIAGGTYTLGSHIENATLTNTVAYNLTGNSLKNTLMGNEANNILDGGDGNDTMIGGAGNDVYYVAEIGDSVVEAANGGIDRVRSDISYSLTANVEHLNLEGNFDINGTGNTLDNIINGNNYNNILNGGTGADRMSGGGGNDTYIVDNVGDQVNETTGEYNWDTLIFSPTYINAGGIDTVQSSVTFSLASIAYLENLTLTGTSAINATGNYLNNTITGNKGANILDGGKSQFVGEGADTMIGGDGSDTYVVNNTGDVVIETNALTAGGTDLVQVAINIAGGTYTLGSHIENATLTNTVAYNLTGNSLKNTLMGNEANNILDGGDGNDTMIGGAGNDIYLADIIAASGALQDTIIEAANAGTDTLQLRGTSTNFLAARLTLASNLENLDASNTGASLLNLTGNSANNVLTGNAANNTLDGGKGTDTLFGGAGDDTYLVDSTSDTIIELINEGTDLVQSSVTFSLANIAYLENLTLTGISAINATGNTLNNTLVGNSGNNTLNGGDGNDILIGAKGNDTLTGGDGADHFVFNTAPNASSNMDMITDFLSGTDKIDLENSVMSALGLTTGTLSVDQFWAGAGVVKGHDADDRIVYNTTTGALYYDVDGSGSSAAVQIAMMGLSIHPTLSYQDFLIV